MEHPLGSERVNEKADPLKEMMEKKLRGHGARFSTMVSASTSKVEQSILTVL